MATQDEETAGDYIEALTKLRAYVVQARRTTSTAIGTQQDAVDHMIECQVAIKAIDEAIADEERLKRQETNNEAGEEQRAEAQAYPDS